MFIVVNFGFTFQLYWWCDKWKGIKYTIWIWRVIFWNKGESSTNYLYLWQQNYIYYSL